MRSAVIESDTIDLRCGCPSRVNDRLRILRDLIQRPDKKWDLVEVVEHRCGATWIWGEICAPRRKAS